MFTNILIFLGYRSPCCKAVTFEPEGWNRIYCTKCDERLILKWWYRSLGTMVAIALIVFVVVSLLLELI